MIVGESEGGDCDEVISQDEVNQESEQNEVDGMKKRRADSSDAYLKERLVICNKEDTDGGAKVTTDEERVCRLNRDQIV